MTSYVMVPANVVKQACLNFIKSEEEYGKARVEEMIQEEIENNWRWWKSSKTREAAIKRLIGDGTQINWEFTYAKIAKKRAEDDVRHLLAMAKLAQYVRTPVALSGNDAIIVNKYRE